MKLKTILKIIGITWIFVNIWLSLFLGYKIYNKYNELEQKNSSFSIIDRKQFNQELYSKAYTIDNDLIKYISKKIFLINFKNGDKYMNIENLNVNKDYLLKVIKLYSNYSFNKFNQLNSCDKWFWLKDTKKWDWKNKKKETTKSKKKSKKKDNIKAVYSSCIDYMHNYKKTNSNLYLPLITELDINFVKEYNNLSGDSIWVIEDVYSKYCNDKAIWIRDISVDKNQKIKTYLCKNIDQKTKRFYYSKLNIEDIKDIRIISLFFKLFDNEIQQHVKLKWIEDPQLNDIINILKHYDNNGKQISKLIKKKELFTNCYNVSFNPNILTAQNLSWDINNINIIKNYVSTNKHEIICITTNFNKEKLVFNKKIITILTDINLKLKDVDIKNLIYKSMLGIY